MNQTNTLEQKQLGNIADRLDGIREYYFSQKLREIDQLNKEGKQIINLGIGSPDLPPHPDVVSTLAMETARPGNHSYQSYKGSPLLRDAIAAWYSQWYQVTINPATEVLPLIGSKEGIMHICMTYLNPGDEVLIPNPGYPTYRSAATLAGGVVRTYELLESNNWMPDFDALNASDLSNVKMMFVNYPHMPTGTMPHGNVFAQLVAFARQHRILLCHDNPYSFIAPGFGTDSHPVSILSVEGAMDVAIELNSLSKSHNMAGWRVGFLCGAEARINEIMRFKSNMDSGMFLPVQLAAAKALSLDKSWYLQLNAVYDNRRKKVFELLNLLRCKFTENQAGLFVWASVPADYPDGFALSDTVLYNANVFLTPGGIFGEAGKPYIRVSLCASEDVLTESIERVK